MKKIDLDLLHHPKGEGKGSGRTFRMLVDAVHHADFMKENGVVHIIVHSNEYAPYIVSEMAWIAEQLGFEHIKIKSTRIDINNVMFLVHAVSKPLDWDGNSESAHSVTFIDHFALGEE